jgi:Tfp pilus assembly protein PilN
MIDINLMRREKGRREAAPRRTRRPGVSVKVPFNVATLFIVMIVLLLIIVLGGIYLAQTSTISGLERSIRTAEAERAQLQDKINLIEDLKQRESQLKVKFGVIANLDRNRFTEARLLEGISKSLPEYCWLTSLSESPGAVALEGSAFSNMTVAEFMDRLSSSSMFQNVELSATERQATEGKQTIRFTLTASTAAVPPPVAETPSARNRAPAKGGK